ncbi:ATP-binding protein [Chitinimonas sp.]|uniref:ATP-binding protein n=1 Tax=Chitinimonas sp. TaxID=1934313 RepID=UPI0035AF2D16
MKLADPVVIPRGHDGNPLIEACGPYWTHDQIAVHLTQAPPLPCNIESLPPHLRMYEVIGIRQLHVPSSQTIRLAQKLDLMLRDGYRQRDPREPATWRRLYSQRQVTGLPDLVPSVMPVIGISGSGKTMAVHRALARYPQVVVHDRFPNLIGPLKQLMWLRIEVPSSGKASDLVEALMRATDEALGADYFSDYLTSRARPAMSMMNHWLNKVACHFVGAIFLDEINNLFKLETLAEQKKKVRKGETIALRIADDEALKLILTLANTAQSALILGGTPDCMPIFSTRCSTAQRMGTGGFIKLSHFETPDDKQFREHLLPTLCRYQWFDEHLPLTNDLAELIHRFSGGLPRLCIALWIHAHQMAIERGGVGLNFEDFIHAAEGPLAPVQPAVAALLSNSPEKLSNYRDLLAVHDPVWGAL